MEKIEFQEEEPHGTPYFPFESFSQEDSLGNYFVAYHWHDEVEFLFVTRGSFFLRTETSNYVLTAGNVYFINPGVIHGIFGRESNSHHYALLFPVSLLCFNQYDIVQNDFINPILSHRLLFPQGDALQEEARLSIGKLIEKAAVIYDNPAPTMPLTIKTSLYQILEILFDQDAFIPLSSEEYQKMTSGDETLKAVFSYIELHYTDKIALEDLAQKAHMNKNYFCKFFKKKIGKTPFSYLNEYRINQAAGLLKKTSQSVTEIAFHTGFENIGFFIRQFKRYKGCTPTSFRKENT